MLLKCGAFHWEVATSEGSKALSLRFTVLYVPGTLRNHSLADRRERSRHCLLEVFNYDLYLKWTLVLSIDSHEFSQNRCELID